MATHSRSVALGNAGRPASQTPGSGAAVATLEPPAMHAVSQLEADHREIESLLGSLRAAQDPALCADLFGRAIEALEIHLRIEEDLFYPVVARLSGVAADVAPGRREHEEIRARILHAVQVVGDAQDAVESLETCVVHHFGEEEHGLFPQLHGIDYDWTALGLELAAARLRLRRGT